MQLGFGDSTSRFMQGDPVKAQNRFSPLRADADRAKHAKKCPARLQPRQRRHQGPGRNSEAVKIAQAGAAAAQAGGGPIAPSTRQQLQQGRERGTAKPSAKAGSTRGHGARRNAKKASIVRAKARHVAIAAVVPAAWCVRTSGYFDWPSPWIAPDPRHLRPLPHHISRPRPPPLEKRRGRGFVWGPSPRPLVSA